MGSRFGGDKQFTALGPGGETLMDYAIFDAARAGIDRVVLIVRPDALHLLPASQARYGGAVELLAAAQRLEDLPAGCEPARRADAALGHRAGDLGHPRRRWTGPFIVVNGDDFYGAHPMRRW